MTDPTTRDRRPAQAPNPTNTTVLIVAAESDAVQARCRRCGANLSRPESVAAELGPVCRHLEDHAEGVAR